MPEADKLAPAARLKREDYKRTKHDSHFSKWQELIGPNDWEDYAQGKEGAAKYRVHNLPTSSVAGAYELGILLPRSGSGRNVGKKADLDEVVVVYLGQADNVRSRLQRYGRSGDHLANSYTNDDGVADSTAECVSRGRSLFEEIFSRGCSIVFRWAPMRDKRAAEKTEAELLGTFDYAWNKGCNGARRPNDILARLDKTTSNPTGFLKIPKRLQLFGQGRVGIKIEGSRPILLEKCDDPDGDETKNFFSGIFKFSRSQPRLVTDKCGLEVDSLHVCGFILNDGIPCRRPPVPGNKRCEEHKGRRIYGSIYKSTRLGDLQHSQHMYAESNIHNDRDYITACWIKFDDGTFCMRQPVPGRKRCEEHKGMRNKTSICKPMAEDKLPMPALGSVFSSLGESLDNNASSSRSSHVSEHYTICGATLQNGSFCKRQPVQGNKRCWQHKGKRIDSAEHKGLRNETSICKPMAEDKLPMPALGSVFSSFGESLDNNASSSSTSYVSEHYTICGATLENGSFCRRQPVQGNKRCWQHKGMRIDSAEHKEMRNKTSICKPMAEDKLPMPALGSVFSSFGDSLYNNASSSSSSYVSEHYTICGATLENGSFCRRPPVQGNKRCWQHKGKRIDSAVFGNQSFWSRSDTLVCGVTLQNGSACSRPPVHGRKRCAQHKGMRVV